MKRSTQVSLVLMGAVGVGGAAYALGDNCRQSQPGTVAGNQQQPTCRSSGGHGLGFGRGASFFSGSGSSGSSAAGASPASSVGSGGRGGFGSIGAMLGGARA